MSLNTPISNHVCQTAFLTISLEDPPPYTDPAADLSDTNGSAPPHDYEETFDGNGILAVGCVTDASPSAPPLDFADVLDEIAADDERGDLADTSDDECSKKQCLRRIQICVRFVVYKTFRVKIK